MTDYTSVRVYACVSVSLPVCLSDCLSVIFSLWVYVSGCVGHMGVWNKCLDMCVGGKGMNYLYYSLFICDYIYINYVLMVCSYVRLAVCKAH